MAKDINEMDSQATELQATDSQATDSQAEELTHDDLDGVSGGDAPSYVEAVGGGLL
ncbi:MAG: hypothetical protein QOE51_2850 [Actinoplanes sp.]|jgi:hypothetical protein|nr:hypothetical protein [Actinoplanes sp.]